MNILCLLNLHDLKYVRTDPEDPVPDHYECIRPGCHLATPIITTDGEGKS